MRKLNGETADGEKQTKAIQPEADQAYLLSGWNLNGVSDRTHSDPKFDKRYTGKVVGDA